MRPRESGDAAFLDDIREACALIVSRLRKKQLPDFVSDTELQDSVVLRLIVIGEACKNVSERTRRRYPDVQWKDMSRLRDLAVHHYWKIDPVRIWEIVREDVPFLLSRLSKPERSRLG
jgi:uncharacterized protein with HEPN domain